MCPFGSNELITFLTTKKVIRWEFIVKALESDDNDMDPSPAVALLCKFGQLTYLAYVLGSLLIKLL